MTTLMLPVEILFALLSLAGVSWAAWTMIQVLGFRALLFLPFLLLGSLLLLYWGASQLVELLWQLIGREVLELDRDSIRLRHLIVGRGASRRYAAEAVSGVFVSSAAEPAFLAWYAPGTVMRRRRFGPSAFESYTRGRVAVGITAAAAPGEGRSAAQFGSSLQDAEAHRIVAIIHQRFPHYRQGPQVPL